MHVEILTVGDGNIIFFAQGSFPSVEGRVVVDLDLANERLEDKMLPVEKLTERSLSRSNH
jgi:hypothetical protein